jgi:hypothetical protein
MVKKKAKKSEEEEEKEFGPPPFDLKKFYLTETEGAKSTIISVIWGIIMSLVSAAIFIATGHDFAIGAVAGVGAALALKPLFDMAKVITKDFDKMKWLGAGFSYLLTWLAFWILMVNPPLMDLSPPGIKNSTPLRQELGSPIKIVFKATDNSGIASLSMDVRTPSGTELSYTEIPEVSDHLYRQDLNFTALGNYSKTYEGITEIVPSAPPVIELIAPSNGSDVTYDQAIVLHITDNAEMAGVYYTLDSEGAHVMMKMERKGYSSYATGIYKIRSNVSGHQWTGGPHTINVVATDTASNTSNATYSFTLK